jgi:hypothetical protein
VDRLQISEGPGRFKKHLGQCKERRQFHIHGTAYLPMSSSCGKKIDELLPERCTTRNLVTTVGWIRCSALGRGVTAQSAVHEARKLLLLKRRLEEMLHAKLALVTCLLPLVPGDYGTATQQQSQLFRSRSGPAEHISRTTKELAVVVTTFLGLPLKILTGAYQNSSSWVTVIEQRVRDGRDLGTGY